MALPEFVITLREGFEAALIISIIIAFLKKSRREVFIKHVWYGVYAALILSVVIGVSTWFFYGTLAETIKPLFEGIAAWLAVAVLSSVVIWMARKGPTLKTEIEQKVQQVTTRGTILGLTSLSFVMVFREGVETVLFLTPFIVRNPFNSSMGSFLGAVIAIAIAYVFFFVGMKLNLRKFFFFTSILIILIASGLAGYGTHELIEYAEHTGVELGWLAQTAYQLPITADNLLHDKNIIGSILAVLFGYTTKAETGRILLQTLYLATAIPLTIKTYLTTKP